MLKYEKVFGNDEKDTSLLENFEFILRNILLYIIKNLL